MAGKPLISTPKIFALAVSLGIAAAESSAADDPEATGLLRISAPATYSQTIEELEASVDRETVQVFDELQAFVDRNIANRALASLDEAVVAVERTWGIPTPDHRKVVSDRFTAVAKAPDRGRPGHREAHRRLQRRGIFHGERSFYL